LRYCINSASLQFAGKVERRHSDQEDEHKSD